MIGQAIGYCVTMGIPLFCTYQLIRLFVGSPQKK